MPNDFAGSPVDVCEIFAVLSRSRLRLNVSYDLIYCSSPLLCADASCFHKSVTSNEREGPCLTKTNENPKTNPFALAQPRSCSGLSEILREGNFV